MSREPRIELLVPGLLGPLPMPPDEMPRIPVLERLLGRAERLPAAGTDQIATLFDRFGVESDEGQDLPSGPFSHLGDNAEMDSAGFWLHADPVHLRPDRDRLLLFDSRHIGLTPAEAQSLVSLFNTHFVGEGLRLEAPVPQRWYLRADDPPRIKTSPLHAAVGRNIDSLLPAGDDAKAWARLLNEVQMLFHQAEVNRCREEDGRLLVNGIWLWGGGRLPASLSPPEFEVVYADQPLAVGLARAAALQVRSSPDNFDPATDCVSSKNLLLYWDDFLPAVLDVDTAAWVCAAEKLEKWLTGWVRGRGARACGQIEIYPCDGSRFRITPRTMRRFWRRPAALEHLLQDGG